MSNEIQPYIAEAEIVDEACEVCGAPGDLVVDPYQLDVYGKSVLMVLCDYHLSSRYSAI